MFRNILAAAALLIAPGVSSLTPAVAAADESAAASDGVAVQMIEGVEAVHWGYTPLSTAVPTGQKLTWTNIGRLPHTATDDRGAWDTGVVAPGATASLTFTTPGTYAYHCVLHPWMVATLVVAQADVVVPSVVASGDDVVAPEAPAPVEDGLTTTTTP